MKHRYVTLFLEGLANFWSPLDETRTRNELSDISPKVSFKAVLMGILGGIVLASLVVLGNALLSMLPNAGL
jgi:hypothetical protein